MVCLGVQRCPAINLAQPHGQQRRLIAAAMLCLRSLPYESPIPAVGSNLFNGVGLRHPLDMQSVQHQLIID